MTFADIPVQYLVFGGFFLLFALLAIFSVHTAKKRRQDLSDMCIQSGYEFDPYADNLLSEVNGQANPESFLKERSFFEKLFAGASDFAFAFEGLTLFQRGDNQKALNLIKAPFEKGKLLFFDYTYHTGSGKNRTKHLFTVALLKTEKPMPKMTIRPENFLDSIGAVIGFEDIDFSQYPEFSKKYHLKGDGHTEIMQFFSFERVKIFENSPPVNFYSAGNFAAIHKKTGAVKAQDYPTYIDECKVFFKSLNL